MGWTPGWKRAQAVDESRWVVLDVEASGLDAARDSLLAIASVAVRVDWPSRSLAIDLGDSFEAVLRQEQPSSRDNILLHGIGVARQSGGLPAREALQAFAVHAGASPLLAFHAAFDHTLVQRHAKAALGAGLPQPWLDIEHLCGVTHPEVGARSLDEWMDHFGIRCAARHQAAADVLAESELLLRIWPRVAAECGCWRDVQRLAGRRRWIARR
ncbi:3'-5' exonuclease [Ramlibacter sp.]|uniref:3'-5' exonuclease n=1 Tax=Ramlibacter sp. TaxID=1917967 RepID=UPI002FC9DCA3